MDKIIVNDNNLQIGDISKFGSKARAILVKDNRVLLSNYGGFFCFQVGL